VRDYGDFLGIGRRRRRIPGVVVGPPPAAPDGLTELCRRVLTESLAEGERNGVPYSYTRPSPARYPWQWYWDSCFTAIAWRRLDPERPRLELETLLRSGRDDGFIGHVTFWDQPVDRVRRLFYNVDSRKSERTGTIQPPLLAWAWRIAVGDPAAEPRIARHHGWLEANRDLDGDGLLWLIQPDESGLDSSPKFDPVWGWRSHGRTGFALLVAHNRRLGWEARRIRDAGGPVLCEVMTNVLWGLARLAMGEPSITPALVARLWDERSGLFLDEAQPGDLRPDVSTWSAMAPLALPDLPEEIGRRLVEEHLLNPDRYWLPVPPPSVAATEATFRPGKLGTVMRRYWRGPTWVNAAWLLWLGLVRLGYAESAAHLAAKIEETILREGLREYFNPVTGEGLGAIDFAWSSLAMELAEPDLDAAARSYL
jgi:hypothetical protein